MKTCQVHNERQRHRNGTSPQLSRHTHRRSYQSRPYVPLSMFARKGRREVEYRRERNSFPWSLTLPHQSLPFRTHLCSRAKRKHEARGRDAGSRAVVRERWCTNFHLPLLSGFKFSLLLIFFRYGPKGCSNAGEERPWQKPISTNFKISAP